VPSQTEVNVNVDALTGLTTEAEQKACGNDTIGKSSIGWPKTVVHNVQMHAATRLNYRPSWIMTIVHEQ
jgi:hypothetical protein